MSKKKVINKGYTITVTSWENDGDYTATKKINVETLEEAAEIYAEENARDENISYHNLYAPLEYAFKNGAKWQQKQMFLVMDKYVDDVMGGCNLRAKEWFKQYKKKIKCQV